MASKGFYQKRVVPRVLNLEGGYTDNPGDPGNWTGGERGVGELKGTKYGISAASFPDEDIKNLSKERAIELYYKYYWLKGNCDDLPEALAFLHFDSAVQHGVNQARKFLMQSGQEIMAYLSLRMQYYTRLRNFHTDDGDPRNDFGRGWMRRMAHVMEEIDAMETGDSDWMLVVELRDGSGGEPRRLHQPIPADHHVVQRMAFERKRHYVSIQPEGA